MAGACIWQEGQPVSHKQSQISHKTSIMKIIFLCVSLLTTISVWSQQIPITTPEKKALVDSIKKRLERYYVFPEKAKEMGQHLMNRWRSKAYDAISDYNAFLDTLARDIDQVHHDPHMRMGFDPGYVQHLKERKSRPQPTPEKIEAEKVFYRKNNYGFAKVEILPGNIGYMALTEFSRLNEESKTIVASAFEFIAYADAVIVDLRSNNGSYPDMVQDPKSKNIRRPAAGSKFCFM